MLNQPQQPTVNIQVNSPGQPQPGYGQIHAQPPAQGYAQPGYQQPPPGYGQPQYQQAPPGYPQQGYQQPPPGYPTPYPGQQVIVVHQQAPMKKGWERLTERDGVFIKQKFELLETLSGCETPNTYYIFPLSKTGDKKGRKLFKCKEKSDFCARQCLNGDCRPFEMHVNLDDDSEQLDNEPFLRIDRPCKCTFYCFNRPEITVHCVEDGKNEYCGKIVDEWQCCDIVLNLFDSQNNLKYKIHGDCCQCGLHCKAPCDACQNVNFELKTPTGDVVSAIRKKNAGCAASMFTDMDNFTCQFPDKCSKEDRALIISATLFLDYRYFEEKQQNNNRGVAF